jgi:hypothetical protein
LPPKEEGEGDAGENAEGEPEEEEEQEDGGPPEPRTAEVEEGWLSESLLEKAIRRRCLDIDCVRGVVFESLECSYMPDKAAVARALVAAMSTQTLHLVHVSHEQPPPVETDPDAENAEEDPNADGAEENLDEDESKQDVPGEGPSMEGVEEENDEREGDEQEMQGGDVEKPKTEDAEPVYTEEEMEK